MGRGTYFRLGLPRDSHDPRRVLSVLQLPPPPTGRGDPSASRARASRHAAAGRREQLSLVAG
jgi:hypothetical protein